MSLSNLKTKSATLTLKHPSTGKPLKDDNGNLVQLEVVGPDSSAYHKTQDASMVKLHKYQAQLIADGVTDEEQLNEMVREQIEGEFVSDLFAACVVGWDESLNEFFKGEDPEGTGAYSKELIKTLLHNEAFAWLNSQVESFIADRQHFFVK